MQPSDERIREVLELKDHISEKIRAHEEEIELLRRNMDVLDSVLKQASFAKASSLRGGSEPGADSVPITSGADGDVIANAYVTPEKVSIVLNDGIGLDPETPPFKSFFIDRIIGGMRQKDMEEAEGGKLQRDSVIDLMISKSGPNIREIVVRNYRQQERVKEIISTAGWSLARMLEKAGK